jgi:hypothetical protein
LPRDRQQLKGLVERGDDLTKFGAQGRFVLEGADFAGERTSVSTL